MDSLIEEARIAIRAVWQRRWIALCIAWGIALAGWLVVALIPNSYESRARVLVQTDGLLNDKVGITASDQRRDLDRLEQTLTSTVHLARVVRETPLGAGLNDAGVAAEVETLREAIVVKADQDNIFEVTATLSSAGRSDAATATLARDVVDKLIAIVQEDLISGGQSEASQSIRILDEQIAAKGRELQAAEAARVKFETENLGLLPGVGSISQRLASAQAELSQIESQLVSARSALAALNGQLAGTPQTLKTPFADGGGGGGGGGGALAQAQADLASMRARGFTDAHPDVIAMRAQVAQLRAAGSGARGGPSTYASPNPAYSQLASMRAERQAAVGALEARKAAIEGDMAQLRGRQTQEPGVAAQLEELERNYSVLKDTHDKLLADRESLALRRNVTNETDVGRFRLIDPPVAPRSPAAPNRLLLLLGVLVVALGAGVAGAFALSKLTSSFATPARLERATGLPVIGSISRITGPAERAAAQRQRRLFYGGAGALGGLFLVLTAVEIVTRGSVI